MNLKNIISSKTVDERRNDFYDRIMLDSCHKEYKQLKIDNYI